jgi:type I restriction enzyme R subunit
MPGAWKRSSTSCTPHYQGELAKVLVSDDPRVYGKGGLLDQFTNNDMPRIAISVDMLDTGIDVREIVNLVFAKPVYSYTKFWQMVGRGTRLLETTKPKPWCTEKDVFLILDCWDNFEYFKLKPKGKELKPQLPLPVRLVGLRLDKIEKASTPAWPTSPNAKWPSCASRLQRCLSRVGRDQGGRRAAGAAERGKLLDHTDPRQARVSARRNQAAVPHCLRGRLQGHAFRARPARILAGFAQRVTRRTGPQPCETGSSRKIGELPLSVSFVKQEEALIRASQTSHYWETADEDASRRAGRPSLAR